MELPVVVLFPRGMNSAANGQEVSLLMTLLEDFRLGWLPPEHMAALDGFVCSVPTLPAEAAGF